MNAVLPEVVDRLVVLLPSLAGWAQATVYDGQPVTGDAPTSFVTVGYVEGEAVGGSFEPVETFGDLVEETGSVRSEIVCMTGAVDMPAMRAQAFGLFNAWLAEVRRDPTLGLASVSSAALSGDLLPVQNTAGSAVRLAVTLTYTARGI